MSKAKAAEQEHLPATEAAQPERLPATTGGTEAIQQWVERVMQHNPTAENLERIIALSERMADRSARQEFHRALADFQAEVKAIPKQSKATVTTKSGTQYTYRFADLDLIVETVRPLLIKHGLSFTFDSVTMEKQMTVICKLTHVGGHFETSSFSCPVDTLAPVNDQQKSAMAHTYAKRYALTAALGLTTTDPDTDGNVVSGEVITKSQVADLRALIESAKMSESRIKKLLTLMGVEKVDQIRASQYSQAVASVEAVRRQG